MKKITMLSVFILLTLIILPFCVQAEQKEIPKYQERVNLIVSGDQNIKGEVTSYITRELRSLNDVIIVDENADWQISILAMEAITKGSYKGGIALSVVILRPFNNNILKPFIGKLTADQSNLIDALTSFLYRYEEHWLRIGSPDDLKSICQGIVADFDSKHLEKSRRLYQQTNDALKKQK